MRPADSLDDSADTIRPGATNMTANMTAGSALRVRSVMPSLLNAQPALRSGGGNPPQHAAAQCQTGGDPINSTRSRRDQ
jgi:hypothetical protein